MKIPLNWKVILIFAALAAILFVNNGKISLWDQDEAAYAGFAKQMIESKDYIVPQFTWSEPHRKPPLHFWLIAIAYKIFGVNEFALRFFVALAVFGTYLLIYFFGQKFIDQKAALYSAIILGTSFFVPMLGKVAVTDGLLLFFHTLAGFSLLMVLEKRKWKYVFWFYFALAFGMLVKGPPILIFTGFFVIILYALHPKRKNLLILHPWFFGWFALAPLFIWGYLAWKENPQFVKWLIDWYILKRVNSDVFGQTGPVGYYIVTITAFFASYFAFFPAAFKNSIKALWEKPKNQWFLIGSWMVSGWLFYEFLKSKLPAYALAAYPGFAMALGYQIVESSQKAKDYALLKISAIFHFIIATSITVGLIYFSQKFFERQDYAQAFSIAAVYFMLTVYGLVLLWLKQIERSAKILMLNAGIFVFLIFAALLPKFDNLRNAPYKAAKYIYDNASSNTTIVVANHYADPPSLPFYLQKYMPDAKLIYTENYKQIEQIYDTTANCVLILSPQLDDQFQAEHPALYVKRISTRIIDRPGYLTYFIVIKRN